MVTKAGKVKEYALNNVTNTDIWTDEHSSWRVILSNYSF